MRRRTVLAVGGGVGGLALYNRRLETSGGEIPDRLGGQGRRYRWKGHDLAYSVAGEGEPLLLVHGIYAGASSFEFRKNFGRRSGARPTSSPARSPRRSWCPPPCAARGSSTS